MVYLSSCQGFINLDLSPCLGGSFPILMAGDLNGKHVHWNSMLITPRGRGFCDCANEYSCLIFRLDTPTTIPCNIFPISDALDIVIAKDWVTPAYLTTCSELSTDQLPVPINTQCQSSFLNPLECPDLRTDWSKFHFSLEVGLPSNPDLLNEVPCVECVKKLPSVILMVLAESTSKCCLSENSRPLILAHIEDEIHLKNQLRRQWQITRFKASVTEPSNVVKQAQQAKGHQPAPTSVSFLVGCLVGTQAFV